MLVEVCLVFNGECEEAFNFYRSALDLPSYAILRYKDMRDTSGMAEADANRVIHASLPIGTLMLMGADAPSWQPVKRGENFYVCLTPRDYAEAKKTFNRLSEDGHVTMALGKTSWADLYGSFVDRFGIPWMVNYSAGKRQT